MKKRINEYLSQLFYIYIYNLKVYKIISPLTFSYYIYIELLN